MLRLVFFEIITPMKQIFKKLGMASLTAFVVAISFFAGLYVNAEKAALYDKVTSISVGGASTPQGVDLSPFWKAWTVINEEYVPTGIASTTVATNKDKVYGAIKGLASSLGDPFTVFLTPDEAKNFTTDLSGSLEGIGAVLSLQEGILTVSSTIKGSPAEKAGLLSGDVILKVGDTQTKGLDIDRAVQLIRGPKGTNVTLLIHRSGRPDYPVTMTRDTIKTPIVTTKQYPNSTFVITLASFTENSADLFRSALREFVNSGSKHLVLDLRNNTGGYLDAAVDMASWFLPAGQTIVTEDYGKNADPTVFQSKGYNLFNQNMKVVILVNENTASASEILSGALHDTGKAILVGKKTYGKGSVQELVPITSDTLLKVTVARWLTPKGTSISLNGITPDFTADLTLDDVKAGRDPQMERALDLASRN